VNPENLKQEVDVLVVDFMNTDCVTAVHCQQRSVCLSAKVKATVYFSVETTKIATNTTKTNNSQSK